MTTTDLTALLAAVAEEPADSPVRLIAADAAEDAGDAELASCLRWLAKNQRAPSHNGEGWEWGSAYFRDPATYEESLPDSVYDCIPWEEIFCQSSTKGGIFAALYAAWRAARASGWKPE